MKSNKYFKMDDQNIYLNTSYAEFYIPEYYFTKGFAVDNVDRITIFGIFNIGFFENGKLIEEYLFAIPSTMDINVYDMEVRDVTFKNNKTEKCRVYKYYKDNIICNNSVVEDSDNASSYLNMLISASLPDTIPYSEGLSMWRKNIELNNVSFGVSSVILELIIAVCYRNANKVEDKFAKRYGSDPSCGEYDYLKATIRQICQYASTYVGMTFEDMNSMITTSLNRTRKGAIENETPVEKIIKY